MDHRPDHRGKRLTAKGIQHLINSYGRQLGIPLTASVLRYTAIQTALSMTNGDVEKVRQFSRVADSRTIAACERQRQPALKERYGIRRAYAQDLKSHSASLRARSDAARARCKDELERAQKAVNCSIKASEQSPLERKPKN